jgi:hypothetical protein
VRLCNSILRLYPADFRAWFAAEMAASFEEVAGQRRRAGRFAYIGFLLAELRDLLRGAAAEWIAKLTTDALDRARVLPDWRLMRPTGIPREIWFAEKNVEFNIAHMVNAIATHQFEQARFYSEEERKARETLRLLREKEQ